MLDRLPRMSIAQWNLKHMLFRIPLPLVKYLDDGAPPEAFENPHWPAALCAPAPRNVGFVHQASQWSHVPRTAQIISTIKEACLRGFRSGLEGISIHGEVSTRHIPYALNYLAFSHFIHWPEDTLRNFGRTTLGQVLGGEDEGVAFVELMARWDGGLLTEEDRRDLRARVGALRRTVAQGSAESLERWRLWNWLDRMCRGIVERHTVSFV